MKLLLEDGREDIDFQNDFGYTALIEAVGLREGNQLYQDIVKIVNGKMVRINPLKTILVEQQWTMPIKKGYTEISKNFSTVQLSIVSFREGINTGRSEGKHELLVKKMFELKQGIKKKVTGYLGQ